MRKAVPLLLVVCACVEKTPPRAPPTAEERLRRAGFATESDARRFLGGVLARQGTFRFPQRARDAVTARGLIPFGAARRPFQAADVDCDGTPDALVLAVDSRAPLGRALANNEVLFGDALADAVLEARKLDGDAFGQLVVVRSNGAVEVHGSGEFDVTALPKCPGYDRAWAAAHRCKAVEHGWTESDPGMTLVFDHASGRLVDLRCE